jgi:hypothetical protein
MRTVSFILFAVSFLSGMASIWKAETPDSGTRALASVHAGAGTSITQEAPVIPDPAQFDEFTASGKLEWTRWILRHATADELPDLWQWLRRIRTERGYDYLDVVLLHDAMLDRWSRVDPEGGIEFLKQEEWIEFYSHQANPYHEILGMWLARDPDAAKALAAQLEEDDVWYKVKYFLEEHAPPAMLCEQIMPMMREGIINFSEDAFSLTHAAEAFASADPAAALAWAREIDDPVKRTVAMIAAYKQSDRKAGLAYLENLPGIGDWKDSREKLVLALSATDLQAALEFFEKIPNPSMDREKIVANAVIAQAKRGNFEEAISTITSEPNNEVSAVFALWYDRDREAATRYFENLDPVSPFFAQFASPFQERDLKTFERLARQDNEQALKQATELDFMESEKLKAAKRRAIVALWSEDKATARSYIEQLEEADQHAVMADLAGLLARTDEREGLEIAMLLPEGPNRTQALSSVFGAWKSRDFEAAVEWAISQPSSDMRDGLFLSTAWHFNRIFRS